MSSEVPSDSSSGVLISTSDRYWGQPPPTLLLSSAEAKVRDGAFRFHPTQPSGAASHIQVGDEARAAICLLGLAPGTLFDGD